MPTRPRLRKPFTALLALALAIGGLSGWLHPVTAAGSEICTADGTRRVAANGDSPLPAKRTPHDCGYCASAAGSATPPPADALIPARPQAAQFTLRLGTPKVRPSNVIAAPRAPPVFS